jgi:hypothetical protein
VGPGEDTAEAPTLDEHPGDNLETRRRGVLRDDGSGGDVHLGATDRIGPQLPERSEATTGP